MSSDGPNDLERQRLRSLCRALAAGCASQPLVVQIERVLSHITTDEEREAIEEPRQVVAAFRARKLIPPRLIEMFEKYLEPAKAEPAPTPRALVMAICFAACAYPQRAFSMAPHECSLRVKAFLQAHRAIEIIDFGDKTHSDQIIVGLVVAGRLPKRMPLEQLKELLSDLSAAEMVSRQTPEIAERQTEERLSGSALYLTTCYRASIARICKNWRQDSRLLGYLRRYMTTLPSITTNQSYGDIDETRITAGLARLLPVEPAEYHRQAYILERTARAEAHRWVEPGLVTERAAEFWEEVFKKLICGFPYFAFRSRYGYWFKQVAGRHNFSQNRFDSFDDLRGGGATEDPMPADGFSRQRFLQLRQGYRLIRTTFFQRGDKKKAAEETKEHARENEKPRRLVDTIWQCRVQELMDDDMSPGSLKEIIKLFPDIPRGTIDVFNRRVQLRMKAYYLARVERLSNSKIRAARLPLKRAREVKPLGSEKGLLTIATLARAVPPDRTLLWAFTAHVFLHPRIEPQRPDPWTFKRYVGELWRWVRQEDFYDATEPIIAGTGRADRAAQSAMRESPFKELLRDLRRLRTEEELEDYLAERDFVCERQAALDLLIKLAGASALESCREEALDQYRRLIGREGYHWIVPVWYLAVVERLDLGQILTQLKVDNDEMEAVAGLYKEIRARCERGL
jgi:hypothetical protein